MKKGHRNKIITNDTQALMLEVGLTNIIIEQMNEKNVINNFIYDTQYLKNKLMELVNETHDQEQLNELKEAYVRNCNTLEKYLKDMLEPIKDMNKEKVEQLIKDLYY